MEMENCERKKEILERLAASLTKDIVEFIMKAVNEKDLEKMSELLLKGRNVNN